MEGWGLYAENPLISDDTDVYVGEPMKKYGMLKWQVRINKFVNNFVSVLLEESFACTHA